MRRPDLLHHEPRERPDRAFVENQLPFAFESGAARGAFARPPEERDGASTWDPDCFADHVFLDELVESCFPFTVDGERHRVHGDALGAVLSRPPADPRDVAIRQEVLRELDGVPAARADLERAFGALVRLRTLLEEGDSIPLSLLRRKIEILATLRAATDALAEGFGESHSALRRLRELGESVREGVAFHRLCELLSFEDDLSTVEVRLRLGYDGRVRGFELLAVRENVASAYVRSPVKRFFTHLWLFFRGYRFGGDELLIRYVDEVFWDLRPAVAALLDVLSDCEVYLASLGFRDLARSKGLAVSLPEVVDPPALDAKEEVPRLLEGLFNPLLLLQDIVPRPCDLRSDRHDALVVVTGPNSGGKTRLLQAVAIAQMMGQAGLFAPVAGGRLIRAPTLFVSLVDEAAAGQREGRLGTELLRIRRLFEELRPGSMVVLDELCSGTNPSEGEVIFQMVVSLLPVLRPQVLITTHFLGLAERLERERPVEQLSFLQVELDDAHRPTYAFVPGVAQTSLAQQVAARLGVTREELEAIVQRRAEEARGQAAGG